MKIAFTLCSNNYLAQAKTLGDSLLKYNADYKYFIILVDEFSIEIDYGFFDSFEIIPASQLELEHLPSFIERYNIIELNTVIKPFAFQFLFDKYSPQHIHYFDPDILICNSIAEIDSNFKENSILLTPHITRPKNFDDFTNEITFLQFGIYNLGYCGFKNDQTSKKWLKWWADRVKDNCYIKTEEGLFVDQKWMNYATLFFEKLKVLKHPGCNVAYWNLNEREISSNRNKGFLVNESFNLLFFHFSKFDFRNKLLTKTISSFNTSGNDALLALVEMYLELNMNNEYQKLSQVKCHYVKQKERELITKEEKMIKDIVKGIKKSKIKYLKFIILKFFPIFLINLADKINSNKNIIKFYKKIKLKEYTT